MIQSGQFMDFFKTKLRRKFLFAGLYFSEGAPIGFIWLALPTRLRASDVPLEQITWLAAILVLPWTFKFAWAPLIDILRNRFWTLRHWIVTAQVAMGLTLLPLLWLDAQVQFYWMTVFLLCHAFSAATQDVAIDALCISSTAPGERGEYNGWMQTGMMLGRAAMGGGALVMSRYLGDEIVVGMLVLCVMFSMVLVIMSSPPNAADLHYGGRDHWNALLQSIRQALGDRNTWFGLMFAVLAGAAFKSLEVIYGPFLIDRGFTEDTIGWFSLGPMIGMMITGAIAGGWTTDRFGARRCVTVALIFIAFLIAGLAVCDRYNGETKSIFLLVMLAIIAFGIGAFTSSSYALFMDITRPAIAATQFSAFMGATNGCESWSSYVSGRIIAEQGYPSAMLVMSLASLLALPLLAGFRIIRRDQQQKTTIASV